MPHHSNKHSHLLSALRERTDFDVCWYWPYPLSDKGYGRYQIRRKSLLSHRESYKRFYGVDPGELLVLHKCDNRACFNPKHLFLGTNQDNMDDMNRKGRGNKGKLRPKLGRHLAVLTELDVRCIRQLAKIGYSLKEITQEYPVSYRGIWSIVNRKSWKHIP
jgi:hypothetical protein